MRGIMTRGVSLVHLFIISVSISLLVLSSMLVLSYTSISKNGLFIYAVDIKSLVEQGNTAYVEGRSEEAIQYFDQALAIEPDIVIALVNKGLALEDLDRTEEAIQYYDRAIAIDPTDVDLQNNKDALLSLSSLANRSQNKPATS
jgi:tetratricopeptide (TPR) repeat protein